MYFQMKNNKWIAQMVFLFAVLIFSAPYLLASDSYVQKRQAMVKNDIKGRGINDKKVLEAMGKIPRHLFVDKRLRHRAYADRTTNSRKGYYKT